jgi:molybdopterin-binding protein
MAQEYSRPQTVNRRDLRRSNQNSGKSKTNRVMSSSIRNRLPGTIEKIVSDKVVSEIVIRTAAGEVTSVITTGSVQRMNLKEGDQVFAIIKATEVSVEKE